MPMRRSSKPGPVPVAESPRRPTQSESRPRRAARGPLKRTRSPRKGSVAPTGTEMATLGKRAKKGGCIQMETAFWDANPAIYTAKFSQQRGFAGVRDFKWQPCGNCECGPEFSLCAYCVQRRLDPSAHVERILTPAERLANARRRKRLGKE